MTASILGGMLLARCHRAHRKDTQPNTNSTELQRACCHSQQFLFTICRSDECCSAEIHSSDSL